MGKKYNSGGAEKLVDRRDKSKYEETLSEQECLQIENRMLRAENKKQQMEIDFLKKLEEIEREAILERTRHLTAYLAIKELTGEHNGYSVIELCRLGE